MGLFRGLGKAFQSVGRGIGKGAGVVNRAIGKINKYAQPAIGAAIIGASATGVGAVALPFLAGAGLGLGLVEESTAWMTDPKKRAKEWEEKVSKGLDYADKGGSFIRGGVRKLTGALERKVNDAFHMADDFDVNDPLRLPIEGQHRAIQEEYRKNMRNNFQRGSPAISDGLSDYIQKKAKNKDFKGNLFRNSAPRPDF